MRAVRGFTSRRSRGVAGGGGRRRAELVGDLARAAQVSLCFGEVRLVISCVLAIITGLVRLLIRLLIPLLPFLRQGV